MVEVEDVVRCDVCKATDPVITYIFDTRAKEIRIYPFVNSSNISIQLHKIKIKKKPCKTKKDRFDYYATCPRCSKLFWLYSGVPADWDVFAANDRGLSLTSIPLDQIPNDCILAYGKFDKKGNHIFSITNKGEKK